MLESYHTGQEVNVEIIRILPYGVHVKLENGDRGFIRKRDLIYSRVLEDISGQFKLSQIIHAKVLEVSEGANFIFLEHKTFQSDPWLNIKNKLKYDDLVEGTIINELGLCYFVEITPGIIGKLPKNKIFDKSFMKKMLQLLKNDKIKAKINNVDRSNRLVELDLIKAYSDAETAYSPRAPQKHSVNISNANLIKNLTPISTDLMFRNILLVDDDAKILTSLPKIIKSINNKYKIDSRKNVDRLIRNLNVDPYDLIITDLTLNYNINNGYDFISKIRNLSANIPIIVITGNDTVDFESLDENNVNYIIEKPIPPDELRAVLTKLELGTLKKNFTADSIESKQESYLFGRDRNVDRILSHEIDTLMSISKADCVLLLYIEKDEDEIKLFKKKANFNYVSPLDGVKSLKNSPFTDVLLNKEEICRNNYPVKNPGKFKNIIEKLDKMKSFIGVPIESYSDEKYIGLFLLGSRPDHFKEEFFVETKNFAFKIAYLMDLKSLQDAFSKQQKFLITGQTVTSIIHDIKSDVQALSDNIEMLHIYIDIDNQELVPNRLKREINVIKKQKDILTKKLRNVSHLYKEEASDEVDLEEVMENVSSQVFERLNEKSIEFNYSIQEDVPVITSYQVRIEQILINLLLNAEYHINEFRESNGLITVNVEYNKDLNYPIIIKVKDNGPGIHNKEQNKIFDLFHTTRKEGMGLGLFMCRSLAESMGGKLSLVSSHLYFGSEFKLELKEQKTNNESEYH